MTRRRAPISRALSARAAVTAPVSVAHRLARALVVAGALACVACGPETTREVRSDQLLSALSKRAWDASETLIEDGADVNHRFGVHDGRSVLMLLHDDASAVSFLLDHGADPDRRDAHGGTALMLAAESGSVQSMGLLLAAGADPRLTDDGGRTALDRARAARREAAVELLERQEAP